MATLTISVNSGLGTNTTTLTFSAQDSQRIFTAYQNIVQTGGTQAQMVQWFALQAQQLFNSIVTKNEQVSPTPPAVNSANS